MAKITSAPAVENPYAGLPLEKLQEIHKTFKMNGAPIPPQLDALLPGEYGTVQVQVNRNQPLLEGNLLLGTVVNAAEGTVNDAASELSAEEKGFLAQCRVNITFSDPQQFVEIGGVLKREKSGKKNQTTGKDQYFEGRLPQGRVMTVDLAGPALLGQRNLKDKNRQPILDEEGNIQQEFVLNIIVRRVVEFGDLIATQANLGTGSERLAKLQTAQNLAIQVSSQGLSEWYKQRDAALTGVAESGMEEASVPAEIS